MKLKFKKHRYPPIWNVRKDDFSWGMASNPRRHIDDAIRLYDITQRLRGLR